MENTWKWGKFDVMAITQQKVLTKVFGDPQKRILRRLQKKVDEINAIGPKYKKLSDEL